MRHSSNLYPASIARCQHLKINGVQCGSPALKDRRYCYFHERAHQRPSKSKMVQARREYECYEIPLLEDANSVQIAIMKIMHLIINNMIEHKKAALLLYALQTAASNVRLTRFEPLPRQVVINRSGVWETNIGDNAWYDKDFEDEEDEIEDDENEETGEELHDGEESEEDESDGEEDSGDEDSDDLERDSAKVEAGAQNLPEKKRPEFVKVEQVADKAADARNHNPGGS